MIERADLDLFHFVADAEAAWTVLAEQGVAIDPDAKGQ